MAAGDSANPFQKQYQDDQVFASQLNKVAGSFGGKEREMGPVQKETQAPVEEAVEIPVTPEIGKEVEGYVEATPELPALDSKTKEEYIGEVLLQSANPQQATVILPLTRQQTEDETKHPVEMAFTWLREWCRRQLKMLGSRVKFKDEAA
jgi:hypothetical protein